MASNQISLNDVACAGLGTTFDPSVCKQTMNIAVPSPLYPWDGVQNIYDCNSYGFGSCHLHGTFPCPNRWVTETSPKANLPTEMIKPPLSLDITEQMIIRESMKLLYPIPNDPLLLLLE